MKESADCRSATQQIGNLRCSGESDATLAGRVANGGSPADYKSANVC